MKIAIPADGKTKESSVCISFGRAPYFLIYNTDTQESVFIENYAAVSQGGAGIKAAQTVVDSEAGALVTPRCGENAAKIINTANIRIYKTMNDSIKDNIAAFEGGRLSLLDEIHPGFHGHGGE